MTTETPATVATVATVATEQLTLLPVAPAGGRGRTRPRARRRFPAKLRLDDETRRIGLAAIAEMKALLEAQAQRRAAEAAAHEPLPRRRAA